ncbi:2Fe-2S iron-sulfur cluster-binding protein [Niallia endozanthoxylica]|uniref:2Fe-2S iron-sulfur cluster binding domain-containing protein n=1 Tax=Niallia endozanthoxylica TaxID=2036016 RepID=A0A5J5I1P7_9BACI|nr:2Fe-2S iron-sulfur cluster binding domain-containing protein [Niallia endozanthoxylica]KAA9028525.1 2Fe-2S iron-sulfur cluster binding domain-containing protein [Niallia endozanthoxylica]
MVKVTLKARGQQFEYSCTPDVTPLRAARDQFIPIPTGCIRGGCGMCKVKVLDGEYEQDMIRSHDALSDEELAKGFALACCMKAKGDLDIITLEDYEKVQQEDISGRN